jgi:hypothetical protein
VAERLHHLSPTIVVLVPKVEVLAQRDRDRAKQAMVSTSLLTFLPPYWNTTHRGSASGSTTRICRSPRWLSSSFGNSPGPNSWELPIPADSRAIARTGWRCPGMRSQSGYSRSAIL